MIEPETAFIDWSNVAGPALMDDIAHAEDLMFRSCHGGHGSMTANVRAMIEELEFLRAIKFGDS